MFIIIIEDYPKEGKSAVVNTLGQKLERVTQMAYKLRQLQEYRGYDISIREVKWEHVFDMAMALEN